MSKRKSLIQLIRREEAYADEHLEDYEHKEKPVGEIELTCDGGGDACREPSPPQPAPRKQL